MVWTRFELYLKNYDVSVENQTGQLILIFRELLLWKLVSFTFGRGLEIGSQQSNVKISML